MARPKQYWNEKHENLTLRWCSATTESEITEVYYALKPNIHYMVVQIMQKYFTVPQARQNDMINDCITEAFLRLKKYYNPEKQKSYSYASMVIKNYLHEQMVRQPNTQRVAQIELLDGEEDTLDRFENGIDYGEPREIDFKAILEYFEAARLKVVQRKESLIKRKKSGKNIEYYEIQAYGNLIKKYDKQIRCCDLCLEFIERFESINTNNMAEYVFLNMDLTYSTVMGYFRRLFNLNVSFVKDSHIATEELRFNYWNDDYTPIENRNTRRSKKKKNNFYQF